MGRYQCAEDLMTGHRGVKGAIKRMALPLFGAAHVLDAEHGDGQPLKLELQVSANSLQSYVCSADEDSRCRLMLHRQM